MFTDYHLSSLYNYEDLEELRPVGKGITRSFRGELPNGEHLLLKRRDHNWDNQYYCGHCETDDITTSMLNEQAWWDITQILGEAWHIVPPCSIVQSVRFHSSRFKDAENRPSTGCSWSTYKGDDKDYWFTGTVHYWMDGCSHGYHSPSVGTEQYLWQSYAKMRMLDCLFKSGDRHDANYLIDQYSFDENDHPRVWAIDNGRSFIYRDYDGTDDAVRLVNGVLDWPKLANMPPRGKALYYHLAGDLVNHFDEICGYLDDEGINNEPSLMEAALLLIVEETHKVGASPELKPPTGCTCDQCRRYSDG
jgi:hypothetical protein